MDPSPRCVVVVVWMRRWIMHYVSSIAYTGDWMRRIHEQGASTHRFEPPVRWGKGRRRRAGDHVLPEQQKAFEIATGGSPIKERSAQLRPTTHSHDIRSAEDARADSKNLNRGAAGAERPIMNSLQRCRWERDQRRTEAEEAAVIVQGWRQQAPMRSKPKRRIRRVGIVMSRPIASDSGASTRPIEGSERPIGGGCTSTAHQPAESPTDMAVGCSVSQNLNKHRTGHVTARHRQGG